jgi:hypothetical protein
MIYIRTCERHLNYYVNKISMGRRCAAVRPVAYQNMWLGGTSEVWNRCVISVVALEEGRHVHEQIIQMQLHNM